MVLALAINPEGFIKVLTTTAENKLEEQVAFRNCSMTQAQVAEIYDALKYKQQPFKRRKICSTQTHPTNSLYNCLTMSYA